MEGIIFLTVLVVLAIVILFVIGLAKVFTTASKMNLLFLKLSDIELELQKLRQSFKAVSSTDEVVVEQRDNVGESAVLEPRLALESEKTVFDSDLDRPIDLGGDSASINLAENLLYQPVLDESMKEELVLEDQNQAASIPNVVQEVLRSERQHRKKSALELFFSDNLLTKIGIITFVLGVGFFVKYAIDKEWINEVGRVGIGILTGAVMIGIAHELRKNLNVFSSILVGGGIAVFYITITLAFREYELFNQGVAFFILILITIFSVVLSLFYNRKELAVFSLLGGFMAPLMVSTGQGNHIVLFSYILILNSGMLYLSLKKNWAIIGYISFVLTGFFKVMWLANGFVDQYLGASLFVLLFFVQFYIVALVNTLKGKRIMPHILLIVLNNMLFLGVFLYLFNNYEGVNFKGLVTMSFAMINLFVLIYLRKQQKMNTLYVYTVLGIVVSLVTLAIPIQLNGHYITMFWAAEVVVLLMLYLRSNLKIFYTGFLLVSILALISYVMDVGMLDRSRYADLIFNRLFVTGLVVFSAFFIVQAVHRKYKIQTTSTVFFPYVLRVLAFVVPFIELNKELYFLVDTASSGVFDVIVYLIYIVSYAAVVFLISSKSILNYWINWGLVLLLCVLVGSNLGDFRIEIFVENVLNEKYFWTSFLLFPGLIILLAQLYKNPTYSKSPKVIRWLLPVFSLMFLCFFIDNIAVWVRRGTELMTYSEYNDIIVAAHIVVYPIVWAGLALFLTYLGVKNQHIFLRQIALALLGLTIVKFYVLDVWSMSEGGKVLSFVLLGLIILIIAFLLNRIKGILAHREQLPKEEKQDLTSEKSNREERE